MWLFSTLSSQHQTCWDPALTESRDQLGGSVCIGSENALAEGSKIQFVVSFVLPGI